MPVWWTSWTSSGHTGGTSSGHKGPSSVGLWVDVVVKKVGGSVDVSAAVGEFVESSVGDGVRIGGSLVMVGLPDGDALGLTVVMRVVRVVVAMVGLPDGDALGLPEGLAEGDALGDAFGLPDGDALGDALGLPEGLAEGDTLGESLGDALGDTLGLPEGLAEGDTLGDALGLVVGLKVASEHLSTHAPSPNSEQVLSLQISVISLQSF